MEREDMLNRIAEIIEAELTRDWVATTVGYPTGQAEDLRCAALFAHEEFPMATSRDFADAGQLLEDHNLRHNTLMARWNDSKRIAGDEW